MLPKADHDHLSANFDFQYHPIAPGYTRLLRFLPESSPDNIRCNLHEHNSISNNGTQYVALSYRWGSSHRARTIVVDNRAFHVTNNLHEALIVLQEHYKDHTFWVDAICINQQDPIERGLQVQQMWRIFAQASQVVAWLGPERSSTRQAFGTMREVLSWLESRRKPGERFAWKTDTDSDDAVDALLSCRYFSRVWVIPEILQARFITILCGSQSCSWTDLARLVDERQLHELRKWKPLRRRHVERLCQARRDALSFVPRPESFDHILRAYTHSACSDKRDRIYAVLGDPRVRMLGTLTYLRVDYNITAEELWIAVMRQYYELNVRIGLFSGASDLPRIGHSISFIRKDGILETVSAALAIDSATG